jgi:putative membrane protein
VGGPVAASRLPGGSLEAQEWMEMAWDPVAGLLVVAAGVLYAAGARRHPRRWPAGRSVAWAAGLLAVLGATQGWLPALESESFTAHAVQHALLGMVAPLLLALAAPVTLALQSADRTTQVALLRILRSRAVGVVTHPVVVWCVAGATLVAIYTTSLYELSVEDDLVHVGLHAHVLASGFLFCWTAVGVDPGPRRLPHPARVLFVLLAVPFHAIVAVTMAGDPERAAGAAVLWATGEVFGLVLTGIAVARWAAADDREAGRAQASDPAVSRR